MELMHPIKTNNAMALCRAELRQETSAGAAAEVMGSAR
jgi:hypothetical protein